MSVSIQNKRKERGKNSAQKPFCLNSAINRSSKFSYLPHFIYTIGGHNSLN